MTTETEHETKFAVGRAFNLPDLRDVTARSVRQPERTFTTAYFDTADLRLWSRGITLRYRSGRVDGPGTWTVKLPGVEGGPTLNRREISWPGAKDQVPDGARALLLGLVRRADLDEVVVMETTRLPWTLHDHAGTQWAELAYDDVTVAGGRQDGMRFRQIEIELTGEHTDDGADEAIAAVADTLLRAGAQPDGQAKLAKALGLPAEGRARGGNKTDRPSTAADVTRQAISAALERLLDHDYRLRLHSDNPETHDVHQARVATRRLRSDLKTLESMLDPIWLAHTQDELRWLGGVLGAVRDADVMDLSVSPASKSMAGSQGLAELRTKLAGERVDGVADLAAALGSPRYLDLLDRLHAARTHPPFMTDNAPKSLAAREMLPKAVNKRWRRIQKKVAAGGRAPSDRQLHGIRIAAKNLRYACELSEPVIGKPARKTAKLAEEIQTVLGEHHDASAAIDWLTGAGRSGSSRAGFAAGVLTAEQDRRRRKLAKEWRRRWAKLSRPSSCRWLTS